MKTILAFSIMIVIAVSICVSGQKPEEATRKLWDTAFIAPSTARKGTTRRRAYRIATPNVPVNNVAPETVVGVTLWRLRPANRSDSGERLIVHDNDAVSEWLPERISATTRLVQGDKLRISVETVRAGYLYVIDREQYADGTLGEPYLIFPTTRTSGGNNQVAIGRLLEIPAQDDSPPFFTMKKSRPDHVAEVLSVIVAPTPLEEVQISDKALKLTDAQVASWEKAWGTSVGHLEMSTTGQAWTREEKDATTRALTASAPAPQLLFYRPSIKSTEPMFVKLRLQYRR
ncbi:MAG TPA: hypothetical protein VHS05_31265 [Pyrinomonadaceae bacterium]|jgi:hypothetical protein|nr:hypothetical protein [Pyrinomonadaceae bacterium]